MLKAFRYSLYPTKSQEDILDNQLHLCRNLYNCALQERRDAYKKSKVTITGYEQMKYLPEIKEALPEYKAQELHLHRTKKALPDARVWECQSHSFSGSAPAF